ncbi:heme-binding protein [Agrobacterium tumefaciens]|uniref:heme-binding protein n=1 Tax=Agrobacterium tumefaciens TaxID=358 RepID=UPI003AF34687
MFVVYKPANEGLLTMDGRLVVQTGGLPVKIGAVLVGGIGVGGGAIGRHRHQSAREGLNANGAKSATSMARRLPARPLAARAI